MVLRFRKIYRDDLKKLYENASLRPILNVRAKGDVFGVLVEEDENLRGGLTGYIEREKAVIQNIKILDTEDYDELKEGLIRSTIHILDRDGIEVLYSEDMDETYERIGFIKPEDGWESGLGGVLNIPSFFENKCSSCSKNCI